MPLLDPRLAVPVKPEDVVSEKRKEGTPRRTEWVQTLELIAADTIGGLYEPGYMLAIATFNSASGARAKIAQLRERVLPFAEVGRWDFKAVTWIKEDGSGRGSTLYVSYIPDAPAADAEIDDVEAAGEVPRTLEVLSAYITD